MDNWISVNHTLPETNKKILLFSNGTVQHDTFALDHDGAKAGFYWYSEQVNICDDRFPMKNNDKWQPLPEPPTT